MIKKGLLKGLCILGLTLLPISFSNGAWNSVSCYEYTGLSTNVVYGNTILTFNNGNFSTQKGGQSMQNVMWLTPNNFGTNQGQNNLSSAFGYIDGLPYIYAGTNLTSQAINQGFAQDFCYESLDNFNLSTFGTNTNCNNEPISTFLSNKNILGGGYCYPDSENNYLYAPFTYCFYDSDYAYCFKIVSYTNSSNWKILNLSGSIGLSTPLNVSRLQNVSWSPSPFTSSSVVPDSPTDVILPKTDLDRYIDYYETRYNWDERMCYVGTNDLTTLYNSNANMTFNIGTGGTIFSLYNSLYSGWGDNIVVNVGRFINTWLINYSEDIKNSGLIAYYSGPGSNVSIGYNYTGDYFGSFPFAVWSMTYYLYNYYNVRSDNSGTDDGIDVAYYCNLKLNYDRYKNDEEDFEDVENMLPSADKNVVIDYYNRNLSTGSGDIGFIVPTLSGTSWGELWAGNVLPGDGQPINLFKDFFGRITTSINSFDYSDTPIIPNWITWPLIFLVLFRIFKH